MDTVRLFIAIALPERLLEQLALVQRQLERQMPAGSVRWVRPEATHLTLKFLGETSAQRLPQIEQALAQVSRHAPACEIEAGGLGCFPNPRRPSIVWAGLQDPAGRLSGLAERIDRELAHEGFARETRPFHPHLTIGRVRRGARREEAAALGETIAQWPAEALAEVPVGGVTVFGSTLTPSGPVHTRLHESPLAGA